MARAYLMAGFAPMRRVAFLTFVSSVWIATRDWRSPSAGYVRRRVMSAPSVLAFLLAPLRLLYALKKFSHIWMCHRTYADRTARVHLAARGGSPPRATAGERGRRSAITRRRGA